MQRTLQAVLVAVAVTAPAFAPLAARADVAVTFDSGSVAFGYNDGYWDRAHGWHPWPSDRAAADWRAHNAEHYYAWRHDRDHDMGWHEEHWWEHR